MGGLSHQFPLLSSCAHSGCRQLTHLRFCPDHADEDQRAIGALLDEARLERDLALDRYHELEERIALLEGRLGIIRPD
jgi:hypothetical protein